MKKVLLTTSAIVGLTAPAFAADPTAVSDQPYFHHSHPMTWSGSMSIALTNTSTKDADEATLKSKKRDYIFGFIAGDHLAADEGASATVGGNEEAITGTGGLNTGASRTDADSIIDDMITNLNAASTLTVTADNHSAAEDIIDDYLGGSHSEAMDVLMENRANTGTGSDASDLADDLVAFQAAQNANDEAVETTASINTTASLGVSMSAGDGWTASTSGTINLGGGSVSAGAVSLSNGMLTLSVGKSQHSAAAAVSTVYGMDRALNRSS
jgi:hypothetical protein